MIQTYDEALAKARRLQYANEFDNVEDMMQYIFPELKPKEEVLNHAHLIKKLELCLSGAEDQDANGCDRSKDIEAYKWGLKVLRLFPHWQTSTKEHYSDHLYLVKTEDEYIVTNELRDGDTFTNLDNILKIILP